MNSILRILLITSLLLYDGVGWFLGRSPTAAVATEVFSAEAPETEAEAEAKTFSSSWNNPSSRGSENDNSIHQSTQLLDGLCRRLGDEKCSNLKRGMHNRDRPPGGLGLFITKNDVTSSHQATAREESRGGGAGPRRLVRSVSRRDVRLWIVLVRFSDHIDRTLPPKSYFEDLCNGGGAQATPIKSIQEYFAAQTNGVFRMMGCDVTDWTTTDQTEAQAAAVAQTPNMQGAFHNALTQIETTLESTDQFWWVNYDRNVDGEFDLVLFVHSGFPLESSPAIAECQGSVPSNGFVTNPLGNSAWTTSDGLARIGSFAVVSAFHTGACSSPPVKFGVIAGTLMLSMQAYELSDSSAQIQKKELGGIGMHGLMSSFRELPDQSTLPPVSSWTKELLSWAKPQVITADGSYDIINSNPLQQVYRIDKGYATNEYLLVEFRETQNFSGAPISGVLIFHIDNTNFNDGVAEQLNTGSSYPGQADWPRNHYEIALVQADGNFDLEKAVNSGDIGDIWLAGMVLGPSGATEMQPNTDSYTLGETGISISILSISEGMATILVSGVSNQPLPTPPKAPKEKNGEMVTPSSGPVATISASPSSEALVSDDRVFSPDPSSSPVLAPSPTVVAQTDVPAVSHRCNICGCENCSIQAGSGAVLTFENENGQTFRNSCQAIQQIVDNNPNAISQQFCEDSLWRVAYEPCLCFDPVCGEFLLDIFARQGIPDDIIELSDCSVGGSLEEPLSGDEVSLSPSSSVTVTVPTETSSTMVPSVLLPSSQPSQSVAPSWSPNPSVRHADVQLDMGVFSLVISPSTLDENELVGALSTYLTVQIQNSYPNLLQVTLTNTIVTAWELTGQSRRLQGVTTTVAKFEFISQGDFIDTAPDLADLLVLQQSALDNTDALNTALEASPQLKGVGATILHTSADGPGERGQGVVRTTTAGGVSCRGNLFLWSGGLIVSSSAMMWLW